MSLPARLLGANPSIQVSSLLSGTLTTPSAKGAFVPPYVPVTEAFESIATWTSTNPAISFTSIPSTYKHLQIRYYGRTDRADPNGYLGYRFNADSGTVYSALGIQVDTGIMYSGGGGTSGNGFGTNSWGGTGAGNAWGMGIITILNYANTSMYKPVIQWTGDARGTNTGNNGDFGYFTGVYRSTDAINRIDFFAGYAVSALLSGSFVGLYGMKG